MDYIAERNPRAALRVDSEIEQQANRLQDQPNRGRSGRVRDTRELVIQRSSFILVYRVRTHTSCVEMLRVLHAAQPWLADK